MVYKPKRFDAPRGLEVLSTEGQQLVLAARDRLDAWIDENVDRLEVEMKTEIENERQALATELAGLQEELASGKQHMTELLDRIASLEESFDAGDGQTLDEAVRSTREIVQAVRVALEDRERRVRGQIQAALSAGIKGVTGL